MVNNFAFTRMVVVASKRGHPMLRMTMMVLATVAALSGDLPLTRLLAPPHTVVGMDSVMGADTLVGSGMAPAWAVAGAISAVLVRLLAAALRVITFRRRAATALRQHRQSANEMQRAIVRRLTGAVDGRYFAG
jgi:hypothetical protein